MPKFSLIRPEQPLLLLGCGKMGGAMLQGWLKGGLSGEAVIVADPNRAGVLEMLPKLNTKNIVADIADLPGSLAPSFIILAVKPQFMDQAMASLKSLNYADSVFLSIAAGKTVGYFERHLGQAAAIVRAMPNTPASIGKGITVGYPNKNVSDFQKDICHDLLSAVGNVEWVEEEKLIDAVTAVSGSGPAYVFSMVEALAGAGEQIGLPPELARKLARQTICGAGALLEQSDETAAQLRMNVTSPGGTTEAGLNILMGEKGLGKLMGETVRAAHQKSKNLAD